MGSLQACMAEYKRQLGKGVIQVAYKGLMDYMLALRGNFESKHPDCFVSSGLYFGYMDMTYFSFIPESLKERKLKLAIVFLHQAFRFEAWLAGYNKQVQNRYWKLFKESGWKRYRLVETTKGADSILESILADQPDFDDPQALTQRIEQSALQFNRDIEAFLHKHAG